MSFSKWTATKYCQVTITSQKKDFELLKPGRTVNATFYWEQLDRPNQVLMEKCPAIGNPIMQDRTAQRNPVKINKLGCLTQHTLPPLHHRISIYSKRYNVTKKLKIWMILKMPCPDILLKNLLISIDRVLKIYVFKFKVRKRHYFSVALIFTNNFTIT